jgi:hypothetical protein
MESSSVSFTVTLSCLDQHASLLAVLPPISQKIRFWSTLLTFTFPFNTLGKNEYSLQKVMIDMQCKGKNHALEWGELFRSCLTTKKASGNYILSSSPGFQSVHRDNQTTINAPWGSSLFITPIVAAAHHKPTNAIRLNSPIPTSKPD